MTVPESSLRPDRRKSGHHQLTTVDLNDDVVALVHAEPGMNATEIADRLQDRAQSSTIRDHLNYAADKGKVERRGRRYYPVLPPTEDDGQAAIARLDALLHHLRRAPLGLTVEVLAALAAVPEATVEADLIAAARCGWVYRDATATFHVDGHALPARAFSVDSAAVRSALERLARSTRSSAFLATFDLEDSMQIVDHAEWPGVLYSDDIVTGMPFSSHSSALGMALISTFSRAERQQYLRERQLQAFTAATARTIDEVEYKLQKIAHHGMIYVEQGETLSSVRCRAVLARNDGPRTGRFALAIAQRDTVATVSDETVDRALHAGVAELVTALRPVPSLPAIESRPRSAVGG